MNRVGSKGVVRRIAAALVLSVAPFAIVDRAHAQANSCTPATSAATPANNTTVTCTGTVTNQNDPNGYGTGTETGVTVNVQGADPVAGTPAATVTGTSIGIAISDGTINNAGAVTGLTGMSLTTGALNNSGSIQGAPNGIGVQFNGAANATLSNSATGIISAGGSGFHGFNGVIGIVNSGVIEIVKDNGFAVDLFNTSNTLSNSSTGVIRANVNNGIAINGEAINVTDNAGMISAGIGAGLTGGRAIDASVLGGTATVTSSGSIQASSIAIVTDGLLTLDNTGTVTSNGAFAVVSNKGDVKVNQNVIGNTGTITANAAGGIAIQAAGTATVANIGNSVTTGVILGNTNAIKGQTVTVTANTGKIEATAGGGVAINSTGNADITNSNIIQATQPNAIAIQAGGTAKVSNAAPGVITGGRFAINAQAVNLTGNSGRIEATESGNSVNDGVAINAATDATITNSGTIREIANVGTAIAAGGTATIANLASGTVTGDAIGIVAKTVNVLGNAGTIEGISGSGPLGAAAISGDVVTVTANSGIIRDTAAGGRAINASNGASQATVTNLAGGSIIADGTNGVAIDAGNKATVTNAGTIQAANGVAIRSTNTPAAPASAIVTNQNGGKIIAGGTAILADTLSVTNATGASITGDTAIQGAGSVTNAGTITGTTASVQFTGTGTNTLTLQTGSVVSGAAQGALGGAVNKLVLDGHGTASNTFFNFSTLDVNADTAWTWTSNSSIGVTRVNSGALVVDGGLSGTVAVNAGGTLAGHGNILGPVPVASGGVVAPGAGVPFSALTVTGSVNFQSGSFYRVNVNAAGQTDTLQMKGATNTTTLTGGTVNVLAQNGAYAPSTKYTVLTAEGGLGSTTFAGVTTNLAFLTPTLTYDANDVFLTLMANGIVGGGGAGGTGFGFAGVAQTRNQLAVAGALDARPVSSSLVTALLNQTAAGARAAFDALSGELFGSVHNAQGQEASFTRSAILNRLRQASYADVPSELGMLGFAGPELAYGEGDASPGSDAYAANAASMPGKAPPRTDDRSRGLTFWAQGLGGWGHSGSDGNAAGLKNRFGGFLSGVDARYGDTLRAGLVAGYTRSDLNVAARTSSAGIDSIQFGGYAGGRFGALNVRGGASYSYDSIDTSRTIAFPGFSDQTRAHFHGDVGQVFGEVGHGMALGHVALEPFAGLAYVYLRDGSFLESGGVAALSGSHGSENIGYSSLGLRAATAVPLANGTVLIPRGSVQWQYAFGDVTPTSLLAFQSTGAAFSVAGLPIARNSALVEAGFDWRFRPWAKLGAFYQGELAAHAQAHAFKGAFTWDF